MKVMSLVFYRNGLFITILLLASISCKEEDLKWNLERNNSFDLNKISRANLKIKSC